LCKDANFILILEKPAHPLIPTSRLLEVVLEFSVSPDRWAFIVEDDAHNLHAISNLLKDMGISYKRNTTGQDVPDKVRSMQPRPSFLLLDMDLPLGDPFDILEALKADPDLAEIPVIAMADDARLGEHPHMRSAGFAGFIGKPLPRKDFNELLEGWLSGQDW
jgi:two-component system cell cycle response regulator DivK